MLIGGAPEGFFSSTRGLRQGDPLSPLLFSLVAEALSLLLIKADNLDLIRGFSFSSNDVRVNSLQYADDTLALVDGPIQMVENLKSLLLWFEASSGLHVNCEKTQAFQINAYEDWEQVLEIWKCTPGLLPDFYLGLPLASGFKKRESWSGLVENFRSKLAIWKRRYLTKAGRLVLVNSTLATLPIFMMSLFVMPISVGEELERIMRNFLWGSTEEKKKFHLIAWDEVCVGVNWGGLGIRRLRDVNVSLLSKWLWNIGIDDGKLWKRVIFAKYGKAKGGWCTNICNKAHGCSFWKGIMLFKVFFDNNVRYTVGRGDRILFWDHRWCGDVALKERFPNLSLATRTKNCTVAELAVPDVGRMAWDLEPRRRLTEVEVCEAAQLMCLLESVVLTQSEDDRFWGDGSQNFSAKTVSKSLEEKRRLENQLGVTEFPVHRVWKARFVPPKVAFFTWTLLRGRVLTIDKLRKRGMPLINRCCFCKREEESSTHLFVECSHTQGVWEFFWKSLYGIGIIGLSLIERLKQVGGLDLSHIGRLYSEVVFHALVWQIWLERNRRMFEGKERPFHQMINDVKELVWSWTREDCEGRKIMIEQAMFYWDSIIHL